MNENMACDRNALAQRCGSIPGLTSPNRLARSDGWSRETFKPGDAVTITGSPARSGAPSLWVDAVLDGNGKSLLQGE